MAYQGIGKEIILKHRADAADAIANNEDQAINLGFGNRFCIPLNQAGLGDIQEYELTFNDYNSH